MTKLSKKKVEAKNELESYTYSLKNQVGDKDKLGGKLSEEDKKTINDAIEKTISWMDKNSEATTDDLKKQKKELEDVVQPIVSKLYQGAGGQQGGQQQGGAPPTEEEKPTEDKDEL